MKIKKISYIIPCYNSSKTISYVIKEICEVMNDSNYTYEIIPVNDCSTDNVWEVLKNLAFTNKKIKPINLAKNVGRTSSILAGISYANGDIVIIADDDGQCPLDKTFDLIKPIEDDEALVSFAKYPQKMQSKFKNFGSSLNSLMATHLIGKPSDLQISNFSAISKLICNEIIKYTGPYPYLSGLLLRCTNKIANVSMEERKRVYGNTTYTFQKLISIWMNGFTAFSVKPLRVSSVIGFVFSVVGFVLGLYAIIQKIVFKTKITTDHSFIAALILLIGGINMILLGLIGEYLGRIYITINQAPQYTIEEVINNNKK